MSEFLSPHFTLEELTASQTAARAGISNVPSPAIIEKLRQTALFLESVRQELNEQPLIISSGYRSVAVNAAIGSKNNKSQHTKGEAVDFTCPMFGTPKEIVARLAASSVPYDQLILEYYVSPSRPGWVHISFSSANRRQALVIDTQGTRAYA